jgi:hypothetical protein
MLVKHRDNVAIYRKNTLLSEVLYGMARQLSESYGERAAKGVTGGGRALL